MIMKEDYCSFEVAKLLKEKGFDEPCTELNKLCLRDGEKPVLKVTHQKAMKWFREKHIIIVVQPEYFSGSECSYWGVDIWADDNYEKLQGDFSTYEEAVEAALKYCLENLI